MAFALLVDTFQMKMNRKKVNPVQTHEHYLPKQAEITKRCGVKQLELQFCNNTAS
jgi:hypothetical protein